MKRDEYIDFHLVPDGQLAIHADLEEWARWVKPRRQGWPVSPMFRMFRSKAFQWHAPEIRTEINTLKALAMERAVSGLPEAERFAIRWCYCFQGHPSAAARHLGVNRQGLADAVARGRAMLENRTA